MNYAIIIAGGSGHRMKTEIPKQFLSVFDKPVLAYTLEAFQKNTNIDGIVVVCLEGWQSYVLAISKQYGISKLLDIAPGGDVGQESIYNGLICLSKYAKPEDIVLTHDAIRPIVSDAIINDCIRVIAEKGNAVSVIPCNEVMLKNRDDFSSNITIPRDELKRSQTPQGMRLKDYLELHKEAKVKGITTSLATASLLLECGHLVNYSLGSEKNFKLTTPDDLDIFKALLQVGGYK